MSPLADRVIELHDALRSARLPHAFGGAVALAYCTAAPREAHDIDVNVFVAPSRAGEVLAALPARVARAPADIERARADGQLKLWWDTLAVDVFFDTLPFHREVAKGVRRVLFAGRTIPVVGCLTLAVFKATFDRPRHWADVAAMLEAESVEAEQALAWVREMEGPGSRGVSGLEALLTRST